jgi:ACT domain-containing protein
MIKLEVKLPDQPGSLVELIKPISDNGGNIFGILHHHDKKLNNLIPVSISFELKEELRDITLEKIQKEFNEKKIEIVNITLGKEKPQLIVILTGHVFETDIVDTIKKLALKKIKVSELQAKFTEISEISNVKLKLKYPEAITKEQLLLELEKICEEKNLSLLRS